MEHFGDPGFLYSANIAQLWGVLTMRLADAELLPMDFTPYADLILEALDALAKVPIAGGETALDVTAARAKAQTFRTAAVEFHAAAAHLLRDESSSERRRDALNRAAMAVEDNWTVPGGLPGRPWSRHIIHGTRATFAPVLLPGITEAIERGDGKLAREQLTVLAAALDRNTALLRTASAAAGVRTQ